MLNETKLLFPDFKSLCIRMLTEDISEVIRYKLEIKMVLKVSERAQGIRFYLNENVCH